MKPGDRVVYVLPKGNGRLAEKRLYATVINITSKRVVIRVDGTSGHRCTIAAHLRVEEENS